MPETLIVRVPDIGEFDNVDVVEVLVAVGDRVEAEQALIVLESEKASMEIPAPVAGVVETLSVAVEDQVSEGDPIVTLQVAEGAVVPEPQSEASAAASDGSPAPAPEIAAPAPPSAEEPAPSPAAAPESAPASAAVGDGPRKVLVLGAGPGGYTAAFRAADLGHQVTLVEREPTLGGVCLNVGCIPSKTLLHLAGVIEEARAAAEAGVEFGEPRLDFERIRARKDQVVKGLTGGLASLAKQRHVEVITGNGRFSGPRELAVEGPNGRSTHAFDHAIIATGSRNVSLPGMPDDPRILDSTTALEVEGPPGSLLVVGGGVIGLEMATVYGAFGWRVTIVEFLDHLMDGVDRDLFRPLQRRLKARCEAIHTGTRVARIQAETAGLRTSFEGANAPDEAVFDRALIAVGRRPNTEDLGLEAAGVSTDERGFIPVDERTRTGQPHIFAIGDVTGPPLLAHRATHQGAVAAEVIAGLPAAFEPQGVPAVAYTDPEIAWVGLTEEEAKRNGTPVRKGVFPWSASGRALGSGRSEGMTKLLFSEEDGRLLGAGIVGAHAGDLISEAALALEMGANAEDLALTIHPHPTLSETVAFAAEMAAGTITDLLPPKRR